MEHHRSPTLTALKFLFSSCIAPDWSLLQEEVWAWSTAKRKLHQGNHRLAGTLETWFFIFISENLLLKKYTGCVAWRLTACQFMFLCCGFIHLCWTLSSHIWKLIWLPFVPSHPRNKAKLSQTRHCELNESQFTRLTSPRVVFIQVFAQPHSSAGKTTEGPMKPCFIFQI